MIAKDTDWIRLQDEGIIANIDRFLDDPETNKDDRGAFPFGLLLHLGVKEWIKPA